MAPKQQISFGRLNISPKKKRARANQSIITLDLRARRRDAMRSKLDALKKIPPPHATSPLDPSTYLSPSGPKNAPDRPSTPNNSNSSLSTPITLALTTPSAPTDSGLPFPYSPSQTLLLPDYDIEPATPSPNSKQKKPVKAHAQRKSKPRTAAEEAEGTVRRWKMLLPTLEDVYLRYKERTTGKVSGGEDAPVHQCSGSCIVVEQDVHVYCLDYHSIQTFRCCSCQTLAQSLVLDGFFPTSPSQPRMAVAINLLDLYQALCQHSADAVTSLAAALETTYACRGFRLLDAQGNTPTDPLRRALGHSLEWYDMLQNDINRYLENQLENLKMNLPSLPDTISCISSPHSQSNAFLMVPSHTSDDLTPQPDPTNSSDERAEDEPVQETPPTPGQCSGYLQRLCPACFGGEKFGETFDRGGDVHVALDGNFHHRHLKSGGDGVEFYESYRFLSKEYVDSVGARIEEARKKPPKPRVPVVSDEVIDADREAYKAAKGDSEQTSSKRFDENGMMALVCRHDIPLLAASIDTPGEQQKYAVALLEDFFQQIPTQASVAVLYDVGCVLDRSLNTYDFLDESIVIRIQFATAVLHAYGHQWVCQLYYNPRLKKGLGLSDGEGNERLWSNLRKLIGLERRSSRARRIWLLDRQCDAIAQDHRRALGATIQRKLIKYVQKKEADAVRQLRGFGIHMEELRLLWSQQCGAQCSPQSHAPARLKKELEKVLKLTAEIELLEKSIAAIRAAIKKMKFPPTDSLFLLSQLERTHTTLKKKAEELYDSLNIPQNHPTLANVPLEYLHTLLLARDTKIAIRAKAIASFQEFAQIDQAVGGAQEALGTKAHQKTRQAISKRRPALDNLISKFNQYCAYLETSYRPSYNVPVPKPLPSQLATLRNAELSDLYEDVWVTSSSAPPRWLTDNNVRKGIRALLILDRCAEERVRLDKEAKNMCFWFRSELRALMALANDPSSTKYGVLLKLRIQDHLLLVDQWSTAFVNKAAFDEQIALVKSTLQHPAPLPALPIPPPFQFSQSTDDLHKEEYGDSVIDKTEDTEDTEDTEEDVVLADVSHNKSVRAGVEYEDVPESELEPELEPEGLDMENVEPTGEALALADLEDVESDDEDGLIWRLPEPRRIDSVLVRGIKDYKFSRLEGGWNASRSYKSSRTPQRHGFDVRELDILDRPRARLNEDCVNGSALVLQETFGSGDCAVLSTFTIPSILRTSSWTDETWRITRHSGYWTKQTWLIPIHSRTMEHWALAIVNADTRQLLLFDSFASQEFLVNWLPKVQLTVSRLTDMAREHGHPVHESLDCLSEWTARPLQLSAVQSNGYDCGLWVLWVMTAVFRGFDYAHLEEADMPRFRQFIARLIRSLPVKH
ncbi:hypothetical protein PM082_023409 [Marasmius tenuissimus]|nr:hypothetical protein PM082_023409 [Marasmius tenuissimus]